MSAGYDLTQNWHFSTGKEQIDVPLASLCVAIEVDLNKPRVVACVNVHVLRYCLMPSGCYFSDRRLILGSKKVP